MSDCIIGGGSTGSVLAGRLREDPAVRVALLEAGLPDCSALIHCPAGLAVMAKYQLNGWGFHTVAQPGRNGRRGYQPRVVGGNTNAPVVMVTEKAVDMIRQDHFYESQTP